MENTIKQQIIIKKVEKNSELSKNLIDFVENFSWDEVKSHVLSMLQNWDFSGWESVFVACHFDKIVAMATIMKTDYYPLPQIFPWVSTIFVDENYRGNRISQQLVDHANNYAKTLGFNATYIPTDIVGLYEKYGYEYIKDITNYGNGTDRLYVKNL